MTINFPSSPTLNQVYNDGVNYFTWNGTQWVGYSDAPLVGYATEGYVNTQIGLSTVGLLSPTGNGSSLTGIVTSIEAGAGIAIDQSTGRVTITNTGGGGGGIVGLTIKDEGQTVGTAGSIITFNFVGDNIVATASGTISTITVSDQTYVTTAGISTYATTAGIATYATTAGIATVAQGLTGTPDITVGTITADSASFSGVVTATAFYGDGSEITGVVAIGSGVQIRDSGSFVGTASTIDFGDNISVSPISAGVATITSTGEFTLSGSCGTIYSSEAGCCSTGPNNFFVGFRAGRCNTTADDNIFFGCYAGGKTTTGSSNIFMGSLAGCSNVGGLSNIFIGSQSGRFNIGSSNIFVGERSGYWNTYGTYNTFLGHNSGCKNTTANSNSFFGHNSGRANTTGCNNAFFGKNAGCLITTGANNTIIGSVSGSADLSDTVILAAGTCERLKVNAAGLYINGSAFSGGGGGGGGESYWDSTAAGIHTLSNVGIGTTNPTSKLTVQGDASVSGVVTASSFSGSQLSISGVVTATSFAGDGSNVTGISTLNIVDYGVGLGGGGGGGGESYWSQTDVGIHTLSNVGIGTTNPTSKLTVQGNVSVSGVVTATSSVVAKGGISGSYYAEPHSVDDSGIIKIAVTIGDKTDNHRYPGVFEDSYYFDGIEAPYLTFIPGKTYRFDESASGVWPNRIEFFVDEARTQKWTKGVTVSNLPVYTQIAVTEDTPGVLYYESNGSQLYNLGNQINVLSSNVSAGDFYRVKENGELLTVGIGTTQHPQLSGGIFSVLTPGTDYDSLFYVTDYNGVNVLSIYPSTLENVAGNYVDLNFKINESEAYITAYETNSGTSPEKSILSLIAENNIIMYGGESWMQVSRNDGVSLAGISSNSMYLKNASLGSGFYSHFRTTVSGGLFNTTIWHNLTVNGSLSVTGSLSKGSGSFKIDHPLPEKTDTHHLVHSFIEGPKSDLIYRGKVDLINGTSSVNIDEVSGMTEGTFVSLCRDVQCFTSNETGWDSVRGTVSGNILTIECQNTSSTDTISWMVVGERKDAHMYETDWTDENGRVIVEPEKTELSSLEIIEVLDSIPDRFNNKINN